MSLQLRVVSTHSKVKIGRKSGHAIARPTAFKRVFSLFLNRLALAAFFLLSLSAAALTQEQKTTRSLLDELLSKGLDPRWSRKIPAPESLGLKTIPPPIIREVQGPTGPHEVKLKNQNAVVFPNIRMHPNPNGSQSEMSIATHPNNPDVVLAGSNAADNSIIVLSQGWYYTTNGGTTWLGGDTLPTHTNFGQFMSDPATGIDLDGNLFFSTLLIGGTVEVYVSRSTNNGATWTHVSVPNPSGGNDKGHSTIDVNPGGPFENYVYEAYTDFNLSVPNVMFSRSINRGLSFSTPIPISGSVGAQFGQGVNLAVGPGGEVYGTWSGYDAFPTATTHLGFNKSTNGGSSWGTAVSITDVADIRGTLTKGGNSIRVNSFPSMAVDKSGGARNGWIYIVYPAKNPSTPDVFLVRSTNGGTSWSTPLKVNQDVSGKDHWFPWVSCDPATGGLYIAYYDSRNFPANDSAQVYVSTSLDGGFTFEDVLISDHAFLPASIPGLAGGYSGDYIGVAAKNGIVWPCWNDNRTGTHQGYTTRAVFIAVGSPPKISVSPETLNYGNVFLGFAETLSVSIRNLGFPETLHVTNIQSSNSDFSPELTSFDLPGGNGRSVKVVYTPSSPGSVSATLTISSSDTGNPTVTVALLGTGLIPPDISVSPDSLDADLLTGASKVETLTVYNTGGSDLDYDISIEFAGALASAIKPLAIKPLNKGEVTANRNAVQTGLPVWEANGLDEATYRQRFPGSLSKTNFGSVSSQPLDEPSSHAVPSTSAATLIEDFDLPAPWPWAPWIPVFFPSGTTTPACAHDGPRGISEPEWHYRTDVSIGTPGQKLSLWVNPGFGRIYMGFGASAAGAWSLVAAPNTNELIIQQNAGYSFLNLAAVSQTWTSGIWYKLEITFESDGATVTGRVYASDGTTLLNTVSATLTGFQPGGVAIRSFSGFCGDTFESGAALNWLVANPDSGAIPAGESSKVEVTFDATGLNGGDYYANILVSSNDPDEPQDTTPAHLHVTGAPDINLSDDTLDFGSVFTGGSRTETLLVTDPGTDVVMVSSITSDNPNFTVNISSFNLNPGDSQKVLVTFAPTDTGMSAGHLTVVSNDPDEGSLSVYLAGKGILPPDIAVSPDSLDADLFTGEMKIETLTVSNTGHSDLIFDISISGAAPLLPGVKIRNLAKPDFSRLGREISALEFSQTGSGHNAARGLPAQAVLSASAADILILATAPVTGSVVQVLNNLGKSFDLIQTSDFTGIDFSAYKTIIVAMDGGLVETASVQALANAASGGKRLIMLGGTNYPPYYTGMQNYLLSHTGQQGWTISAPPHLQVTDPSHPLAAGLPPNYNFNNPSAAFYMLRINDVNAPVAAINGDGHPILVNKSIGAGSLVYFTNSPFESYWSNPADLAILQTVLNNALNVLSWLSASPGSGTVPAGSSLKVEITFDATGLNGGDYHANIFISSNDPDEDTVRVPAHLHVTGAPDITLSNDSLDYGNVFAGGSRPETLTVSNVGTDLLTVSSISSDNSNFTPAPTSFSLNPGENKKVIVTFAPADSGTFTGQLTVASNDPDQPSVAVSLKGKGLLPPDIGVSPDSLDADLFTGEMKVETLTVSNTGHSDLIFDISIEGAAALSLKARLLKRQLPENRNPLPLNQLKRWSEYREAGKTNQTTATLPPASAANLPLLPIVIQDPAGDGGVVDITILRGARGAGQLQIQMEFSTTINPFDFGGFLSLDIDQNSGTGLPPSFGKPGQDIGVEYEFLFFSLPSGVVNLYNRITGSFIASYPVTIGTHTLNFSAPLADIGNDDGKMDVTGVIGNGSGPTDWFPDVGHGTIGGANFLSANPTSGTVPAGSSMAVEVTFNATGLNGGDYKALILISSNDPAKPQDTVAAHLHVTGAPDIAVSPDSLDYGSVYLTTSASETLVVSNKGTDLLAVSNISSDNTDYSVSPTNFSLNPGQNQNVLVSFAPVATGLSAGFLTIHNNDPTDSMRQVSLTGIGIYPPRMEVSPDSFAFTLNEGDSATASLTIADTGLGMLSFSINVSGAASLQVSSTLSRTPTEVFSRATATLSYEGKGRPVVEIGGVGNQNRVLTAPAVNKPAAGPKILLLFADDVADALDVQSKLLAAGSFSLVDMLDVRTTTPTLTQLQLYDAVLVWSNFAFFDPVALGDVLADYVDAGGGVVTALFAMLQSPSFPNQLIQGRFNAQNYWAIQPANYQFGSRATLGTIYVPGHPTIQNVNTFDGGSSSFRLTGGTIAPGATLIASWSDGQPLVAVKTINGKNRVDLGFFLASSDVRPDLWESTTDGDVMMANALNFVAGPNFLTVTPGSGTVAPGSSVTVEVKVKTDQLDGGTFRANILISGNDPANRQDTVPVRLTVIGKPNIVLSETSISFGNVFVGFPKTMTLRVSNNGSDILQVGGMSLSNSEFSVVNGTVFNLPPGQFRDVQVRFSPSDAGNQTGGLSIHSNDFPDSIVTVPLTGNGVQPGVIQITPGSFAVTLRKGDSTTRTMTIRNAGLGNLGWQISGLAGYLSVSPASGNVAPGTMQDVTVKINAKNLSPGNYQTNIVTTTTNDPAHPQVVVPLSLTVNLCASFKGDINTDGILTAADVVRLLNCVYITPPGCDLCFTDVNCDLRLTSADVVVELNMVFLGLPSGCAAETE